MPPCKKVLLNKIARTEYLSEIIKNASNNIIEQPKTGWIIENGDMQIEYFNGNPFPETITTISLNDQNNDSDNAEDFFSSSDDELNDPEESDEEWERDV